ncbi:hypothetical protein [Nostoc sp.]|uniref:hypothetical protein n=1 Tax=Nostoc sp. TaxID=1180 RepID=UPI002FF8FC16
MGKTLDECAAKYRGFCKKYRPQAKKETRNYWGSKLLLGLKAKAKAKVKKSSPGQMRLPWDEWEATNQEIEKVASRFIFANCYDSQKASIVLQAQQEDFFYAPYQVTET